MTTQLGLADLGDVYQPTFPDQPPTEAEIAEMKLKKQLVSNSLNSIHAGVAAIGSLMADQTEGGDSEIVDIGYLLQDLGRLALNLQISGNNINTVMADRALRVRQ
ncbi:MAG: hypothetical protein AB2552_21005 [Candidatus Thiodiazotropha endolucinida]